MTSQNKGKISYVLQAINIIPLLFFGIVLLLLGTTWFTKSMYAEVETGLANMCDNLITMYDVLYPGDYQLIGENSYELYKGEKNLTNDFSLIDRVKKESGLEITLFYQDTRFLTTIVDDHGARIIGTGAADAVTQNVLQTAVPQFYSKVLIYHSSFFTYYAPLINSDGTVIGLMAVAKPTASVDASVQKAIIPLMFADIVLIVIMSLFTFLYTKKFASSLLQIHHFLGEVSNGNLNSSLPSEVLDRNDELGEIGHSALNMQRSLHTLVEQDALTTLANRRSGDKKLRQIVSSSFTKGTTFCVCIGDIDFFKKVNDTYGHDCGDLILKNVAYKLKEHMRGNGFAARWGGEEFLLVFDNRDLEQSHQILEELLDDIRAMESEYEDQIVKVTMTFGLTLGDTDDITTLLHNADDKLYNGKTSGRNRVIV